MTRTISLDEILLMRTYGEMFQEGTKSEYRALLKQSHPDLHPNDPDKSKAAFIRINSLWSLRTTPNVSIDDLDAGNDHTTLTTKRYAYSKVSLKSSNTGINNYTAVMEGESEKVRLTISSHPKISNKLVEGVRNIKEIKQNIPEHYREFYPDIPDVFNIMQDGIKLSGITQLIPDTFYSLAEVLEEYPDGVHARDSAWIFRRMLVAVGNMHDCDFGHGGIQPDSFMVEPESHRLLIQDFHYVSPLGSDAFMVNKSTKPFYKDSKEVTAEKDLRMLVKLVNDITDLSTAPKRLITFYKAALKCPAGSAAEMLGDYDFVLNEVWGERKFHVFRMPNN